MAKEKALAQSMMKKMDGDEDDYEAQSALRALEDAEKHRNDPHMMRRVKKLAGRKIKALTGIKSIQDIKDAYDDKYGSGSRKKKLDTDGA